MSESDMFPFPESNDCYSPAPEFIKLKLELKTETQAKVEIDRATGPYVHLHLNDGDPGNIDPFLYEHFVGTKIVLLTLEEARKIGQKILDFADHIDKYPDLRHLRKCDE